MNHEQLIAQVRDHGWGEGVNGITDQRISGWINQAYMQLVNDAPGPWLQTSSAVSYSAGTAQGSLPANCTTVKTVRLDNQKLGRLSFEDYLDLVNDQGDGQPAHYALWGGSLYLVPTPDSALQVQVFHWREPEPLSGNSDVPLIPQRFHHLIVLGAVVRGFRELDDTEQEALYAKQYADEVERASAALAREDADRSAGSAEYTLSAMRQQVRDAGFSLGDPLLTGFINDAYLDVMNRYQWPWLIKKVAVQANAGSPELALPADCARTIAIIGPRQRRLDYLDLDERFATEPGSWDETKQGTPEEYSLAGSQTARLWPVPRQDEEYVVWYLREPPPLSAPTDRPELPNLRHSIVFVLGAIVHAANWAARLGESGTGIQARMNQSERYQSQFEDRVEKMRRDYLVNQTDSNSQVLHIPDPYHDEDYC